MIVLHVAAREGQLVLWGEAPAEAGRSPRQRRGGRRGQASPSLPPRPSPFDPGGGRLVEALGEAGLLRPARTEDVASWSAWLPTIGDRPLASSPLIVEPPESDARPELAPWSVSALPLDADQALDLLSASVGRSTLAPGVIVGSTLAYWSDVLRFAGALVARQRFLPGVARVGDHYIARWEPVIGGTDAQLLARLARAMPHAARALTDQADRPPEAAAAATLQAVVIALVDRLVRSGRVEEAFGSAPTARPRRRRQTTRSARAFASLHDQWLDALRSLDNGRLDGEPDELDRLARQVREWRRPISVAEAAPFRLCFRLEEPHSDDGTAGNGGGLGLGSRNGQDRWYVRFLLQASDDPSLLVPVADAWNPRGRTARVLKRRGFAPREFLLAALGQASGICPKVEESLKAAEPSGYEADTTAAHQFLTETAWLLEQAGFGVMLPAWWSRKGTKLRLAARALLKTPKLTSQAGLSLNTILKFRWEIALGDQKLTLRELQALAKLKAPLVKVRGQWVQLSAEEIQAALEFWKAKGEAAVPARQAVQMALGGETKVPGGLAFAGVEASGWIADLLNQLQGDGNGQPGFETLPPPQGFHGELRPYQQRGYSWLGFLRCWGFGACLADDMGLGKTIQTLALVQRDWEASGRRRPVLLICPMSVVGNWQKEAQRFTPELPVMVHHGLTRAKGPTFSKEAKQHAMVISSYALLHRDFEILKSVPWAGVVLDEAQNIKNPQTKQAQAARAIRSDYRVALTGTPVENHVGDLWSLMEFLNPGLLGSQAEFKRSFHIPIQAQHDPDATRKLRQLTGPFILRRLKTDKSIIADLPDKLEMKVFCTLTKEQASLYEAVVEDAAEQIETAEGIQRKGLILATLSKLKQVCNHPTQFLGDNSPLSGRSGKLARLTEMLEEVQEAGDRALIFSQFSEMGMLLQRHLQETFGREVLFLHGGTPKRRRDQMVERFQRSSDDLDAPRLFILSVKAGGTGLNLTAANHVFHFDRWWNPAVENQATDRAFRIGQRRNVQVHKFLCVGTLEESIDTMIERKQTIAGSIVGSGEDWLTKLSTSELKQLFTLRSEALGE